MVGDNLLRIEAKELGADTSKTNFSIFPKWNEIVSPKLQGYLAGKDNVHVLTKGHDLNFEGKPAKELDITTQATHFAVQPINFLGMSPIPKVVVEKGDEVKAGDLLFFDKKRPEIKYVAPVSGEIVAVNRGEKRSIKEVIILADKEMQYRSFETFDYASEPREKLVEYLLEAGIWPLIRQRPYDIVPGIADEPKNIFISTFDSAPLAPDLSFVVGDQKVAFQKGLDVLSKLTPGKVYLGLDGRGEAPSTVFSEAAGVEKHYFAGPHPSGNVGVQIHHVNPINASDKVWTLGVQEVLTIGKLFTEGKYDAKRIVAITGGEVSKPRYVQTYLGVSFESLLKNELKSEHVRLISGDVLSGEAKGMDGFLNFLDDQITVIKEGDQHELFGWLLPLKPRPSISKTFPNFLFRDLEFEANTNTHGEKRAFVVTGQYEKVLPMDILPQHLMKSILVNDYESMEGLGIYELSEEDIALCEFVCTSKQPLQSILREGLEMMREQG